MTLRTHSHSFDLLSLSFNVLFRCDTNRKWPHASPESHGGQQGEDADLEGFVMQTVAVLLTAAVLLNFNTRAGVGTRRRRHAAVFPGLPVAGNATITFYIRCWYHSSVDGETLSSVRCPSTCFVGFCFTSQPTFPTIPFNKPQTNWGKLQQSLWLFTTSCFLSAAVYSAAF